MLQKNLIIKKRQKALTITEFLSPVVFGIALGLTARVALGMKQGGDTKDVIDQIVYTFFLGSAAATFAYFCACSFILNEMVTDKENRMRETLRIMNLNRWSYALSFFITESIFACFTACILFFSFKAAFSFSFGMEKFVIIEKSDRQYNNLFMGFQLMGFNLVAFSMTLSTCFQDSKLAT